MNKISNFKVLTIYISIAFVAIIAAVMARPDVANAQFGGPKAPAGTECKLGVKCNAGPYPIIITFDRTTLNTTDEFLITVQRLDKPTGNWQLQAEIIPSGRTSATDVKYDADRILQTNDPSKLQIKGYYPISGTWWLHLSINGEAGLGQLRIATKVEAPPQMPEWLAWTIALSPILGIIGFALGQWRLVVNRKREENAVALAQAEAQINSSQPPHSIV